MKVCCIGSGSDGNSWYCESAKGTGFFLDAGCPPRAILDLGLEIANKPFFVTHEHGDHAKYAAELHEKYGATIVATPGTLKALRMLPRERETKDASALANGNPDCLAGLKIQAVPVIHNAAEPCGWLISADGETVLYIMDAGQIPKLPRATVQVLICEANYTPEQMAKNAENSKSGLYVSGRVSSGVGHLSSRQAAEIAVHYLMGLDLLLFGHLSKNNFDLIEYFKDKEIPKPVREKVILATPGGFWDTLPF